MIRESMFQDQAALLSCLAARPNDEVTEFTYHPLKGEHLSDVKGLLPYLAKICRMEGKTVKLIAPCGSGKTAFILCGLVRELFGQKQVIILTPNKIQSEQNAQYKIIGPDDILRRTETIVSGKGDLRFEKDHGQSSVYDSIRRILTDQEITMEQLADTVLVVDEAHQMFSAKSYRGECIAIVEAVMRLVQEAGGTVISMTGTPRKIEGRTANYSIYVVGVDESGRPLPELDTYRLRLVRKNSHDSREKAIYSWLRYICSHGKIPLVRINNKELIRKVSQMLKRSGIRCLTLSSDDKGTYIDRDTHEKCYDSPVYQSILQQGLLPEADCYLVTSVIEVGTSIRGIRMEDGRVLTPAKLLPTFAVLNPNECDFDDMRQFFARPRFHVDQCAVFMNYYEPPKTLKEQAARQKQEGTADSKEQETVDTADAKNVRADVSIYSPQEKIAESLKRAMISERALNDSVYGRMSLTAVSGTAEWNAVDLDEEGQARVNNQDAVALGWQDYYHQAYFHPEKAAELFMKEFGVRVLEENVSELPSDGMPEVKTKISDELMSLCRTAIEKEEVQRALIATGEIKNTEDIQKIRRMENGLLLLVTLRDLMAGCTYTPREALETACLICENGRKYKEESRYREGKMETPKAQVIHGIFADMAGWGRSCSMPDLFSYLMCVREGVELESAFSMGNSCVRNLDLHQIFTLNALKNTEYYGVFLDMIRITGIRRWKHVCELAVGLTLEECRSYIRILHYTAWNRVRDVNSEEYRMIVSPEGSLAGAEYHIIRNPEKFFMDEFIDEEEGPHMAPVFPKGFLNKTIYQSDMEFMAKRMGRLVSNLYDKKQRHKVKPYTAATIMRLIQMVYTIKNQDTDALGRVKFVVTGLRKQYRGVRPDERKLLKEASAKDLSAEVTTDCKSTEAAEVKGTAKKAVALPSKMEGNEPTMADFADDVCGFYNELPSLTAADFAKSAVAAARKILRGANPRLAFGATMMMSEYYSAPEEYAAEWAEAVKAEADGYRFIHSPLAGILDGMHRMLSMCLIRKAPAAVTG